MSRSFCFIGVLLVCFCAHLANAQVDKRTRLSKALFKKAEVHYSLGEFEKALSLYRRAFRLKPLPGFLFNIGQCYRNLGKCDKALFFFKQYLIREPRAFNRKDTLKLIRRCEKEEMRKRKSAGASPSSKAASIPSEGPQHQVYDEEEAGPTSQVAHPESSPSKDKSAAKKTTISQIANHPPVEKQDQPQRYRVKGSIKRKAWLWLGAGLSGALLMTGAITGTLALSKSNEYKNPLTSIERRGELRDSGELHATISTVTVVLGLASAVGTGLLYYFSARSEKQNRVSASALPKGGGALLWEGQF